MRVQCPECGVGGNIPSEKIPAEGRKIVCPKCKHSFVVKREESSEAAPVKPPTNAASYYREGVKLLKSKQFDAAIEKLSAVLQEKPDYADAYRYLGLAYGQKKLWDEAIQVLQKAISYNTKDLLSLKNLGVAYLRQERFAEAEETLQQALQYAPQDKRVAAQLDMAVRGRKQAEQAEAAAVEQDDDLEGFSLDSFGADTTAPEAMGPTSIPENPVQAFLDKGAEFIENAQYNKAIESFEEATRLAPDSSAGHFGLGMVYEKKQEWKKAIAAYQKAFDLNPNDTLTKESLRYLKKRKKKRFRFPWQKT